MESHGVQKRDECIDAKAGKMNLPSDDGRVQYLEAHSRERETTSVGHKNGNVINTVEE